MVYVLNIDGQPLMPTERHGKIRRLLKNGKAIVVNKCPFTVRLLYKTTTCKQDITLGIDAGSKYIGMSACTKEKELYAAEIKLRTDIVKLISNRREFRTARRHRKTRYRKSRYLNRIHKRRNGWLAPSVETKIQEHIQAIKKVIKILPIKLIIIETAEFDTQKLKAIENNLETPQGKEYQLGEMYNEYNSRQYVLKRDSYTCQICQKKPTEEKRIKLHVHHIESRKTGSNSPDNLITLCETCHRKLHAGILKTQTFHKKKNSYKDAAFMSLMRKTLLNRMKAMFNLEIIETYGYITKFYREKYGIIKTHINDARCITKCFSAKYLEKVFSIKLIRRHNRQIHRANYSKGNIKKKSQAPYILYGYRLWDKVKYKNSYFYIKSRGTNGSFTLTDFEGKKIYSQTNYKKLKLVRKANHQLIELIPA